MVEFDFAKDIENFSTDVMTGGRDERMYLYHQLIHSMRQAKSIDIIVSFLMESGVKLILDELDSAIKRGANIRILTGNYLGITQPSALYLIKMRLGEQVELRFFNEANVSFHPKSYFFYYNTYSEIFIGSSNISKSALTSGVEWNYRLKSITDPESYERFSRTFEDLFKNHSILIDEKELKRYATHWKRPAVAKDLERYQEGDEEEKIKEQCIIISGDTEKRRRKGLIIKQVEQMQTLYTASREEWRAWLAQNFEKEQEIWFVFPMKAADKDSLSYNDAVEEALCFGWIDSTIRNIDMLHRVQRFTRRRRNSPYSRPNIERLIWLENEGLLHPSVREQVLDLIHTPYIFPEDILDEVRKDSEAWEKFGYLSESYKRIRVAYIDAARKRPKEFQKRLDNFIKKTKANKLIGFGGIEKYY